MKNYFKSSAVLSLAFTVFTLNAQAFTNCASLANSQWAGQTELTPTFNPGSPYELNLNINITKIVSTSIPALYNIVGTMNNASLEGSTCQESNGKVTALIFGDTKSNTVWGTTNSFPFNQLTVKAFTVNWYLSPNDPYSNDYSFTLNGGT